MYRLSILAAILSVLSLATSAHAVTVNQLDSNSAGEHWETNADWDWAAAGVSPGSYAGNDFVNSGTIRTRESGGDTFNGASLTVNGTLALKSSNGQSKTNTVNDLRLDGLISNFTSGSGKTQTLAGGLTFIGDSNVNATKAGETRHITIASLVSGASGITVTHQGGTTSNRVRYTNASNSFSGTWKVNAAELIFNNAGAVGTADIIVSGANADLEIKGDWNIGAELTVTAGTVKLADFDWTVNALTLGSDSIAAGTYTVSELDALGAGVFTGTTGTITVIPEPASLVLMGLGSLCMLSRRRG